MREYPDHDPEDHDGDQGPPDAAGVAPDVQSIHHRLIAEGRLWRRDLPSTQRLIERTQRLTMNSMLTSPRTPQPIIQRLTPRGARATPPSSTKGSADMMPSRMPSRMTSRTRSLWAGIAAILVVALLAGVFAALATSRGRSGPAGAPSPSAQPHGKWQTIDHLTVSTPQPPFVLPAIAPSDPNTVYEATLAPLTLRRTTDQGAHWTELHVPGDTSSLEDIQVFVSPLNAQVVFLTLTSPQAPTGQASACPTNMASQASTGASTVHGSGAAPLAERLPQSGHIPCSLQYYSADGGASWKQLILPVRAALVDPNLYPGLPPTRVLSAQGSRLYAGAGCGPQCEWAGNDIVTSVDGGAHWALANHEIRAAGNEVCDFSAAASGSDVFAITTTDSCGGESWPPMYLWHSRDAGAHWTLVGRLPTNAWLGMAVVSQPSGQPLLYIHLPQPTVQSHMSGITDSPTALMASADGGATWTAAPASGISDPTRPSPDPGPLGMLSNGMVIEFYGAPQAAALYGWKLGETTWRMVAPPPPITGDVRQLLVVRQGENDVLLAVTIGKATTVQLYLP
jgi:hypothetical protein